MSDWNSRLEFQVKGLSQGLITSANTCYHTDKGHEYIANNL